MVKPRSQTELIINSLIALLVVAEKFRFIEKHLVETNRLLSIFFRMAVEPSTCRHPNYEWGLNSLSSLAPFLPHSILKQTQGKHNVPSKYLE